MQVREVEGRDIEDELAKAAAMLKATPGILAVTVLDARRRLELLEPWLGTIGDLDDLPVPRLIAVTIDPDRTARFRRACRTPDATR